MAVNRNINVATQHDLAREIWAIRAGLPIF
jgi:hypothetical protein